MINTHPDADHCGGLTKVLQDFVVEEVWASPLTKTTAAYKNFASAVKSEGLSMKNPSVGTVYTYEYLTLTVLYSGAGTTNANDSSLVVMLQYGSMKFLFNKRIAFILMYM
jgi:beta-lactamase superfamily II metal-dependent hydrolase